MSGKKVSSVVPNNDVSDVEETPKPTRKPHPRKGMPPTDKQLENLRKGMAIMKEKRERIKKQKEELERQIAERRAQGQEVDSDGEREKIKEKPKPIVRKVNREREVIYEPRAERKDKGQARIYNLNKFKDEITESILAKLGQTRVEERIVEKPVERIVEKPVERIVEKQKVVSGSDLLNKIFFK